MCLPGHVKIDEHPKLMALICTAVGIAGIGLILTIAFSDQDTMLGVGIALGVFGVAATILGCIHMTSTSALTDLKNSGEGGDRALGGSAGDLGPEANIGTHSIAPNKVPSPYEISKGKIRGVDDDASPSPTRIAPDTHNSPQGDFIIDMSVNNGANYNNNVRWGGPMNTSSPARGVIPSTTSMYSSSNGSQNQTKNLPPGTIFSSAQRMNRDDPSTNNNNNNNTRALSQLSSNHSNNGALSPFDKRSYPVPASLFPAPSPGMNNNTNNQNNRNTSFNVETGVHNGSSYDRNVAADQIRQNQDEMDAMRRYQEQREQHQPKFGGGTPGRDEYDEDALPKNYWQDKNQ